ncbi:alpha/beta fold hydrolase [Nocardia otitidiscaviarum]|uniref:alpha/beta fold hydrolase n=1 Tax=Nocardia otitidiscaviarum TaxID=1823 RepID=UPI002455E9D3|nr:alpha/beta fold hydrolase [Nocardia otitidiscaviarum]
MVALCRALIGSALAVALLTTAAPATAAPVATPGSLIDVIDRPAGWRGMSDGSVIDYWMTGSQGEPVPASGALFVPAGPPPPDGWPIMVYDHGTSGLGPNCGGQTTPDAEPLWPLFRDLVARGIAVVAPDYLGLGRFDTGTHPYLEIRTEATAAIDLVRAARAANPGLSRTWAVFGESQGGQAALGAAHLQATYAPELDFRGTIALDPESDVEKVAPLMGPWVPNIRALDKITDFSAYILAGLRAARPDFDVDHYLSPTGRAVVDSIGELCSAQITERLAGLSLGDLLAQPLVDDRFRSTLTGYMEVPVAGYDRPILLLVNATDTTVPSPLHAALMAQFAAHGVDFRTVFGLGAHTDMNAAMHEATAAFIARIFAAPAVS